MKHIVKNTEPQDFTDWKGNWPDITPGWAEFDSGAKQPDGNSIKHKVKVALLKEQGGLCCFCESPVEMNHGHIAHLKDQVNHPDLVLEYGNLLYSCPENSRTEPQTCGHAQGREKLPIAPLDVDCESRFSYASTGGIIPRIPGDEKAIETIRILNLDDKRSTMYQKRGEVFQTVETIKHEISAVDFDRWINAELQRQADGTFKPFWTTIKYAAGLYR